MRHLEHVERERVLPAGCRSQQEFGTHATPHRNRRDGQPRSGGGVAYLTARLVNGDADGEGRVLLEDGADGGELVRLQLPRRGDERDDEGARGRRQQPARRLGRDQLA
jgi:hypothetical protein